MRHIIVATLLALGTPAVALDAPTLMATMDNVRALCPYARVNASAFKRELLSLVPASDRNALMAAEKLADKQEIAKLNRIGIHEWCGKAWTSYGPDGTVLRGLLYEANEP